MLRRLLYQDLPEPLRKLIDELQKKGEYLIVENDRKQPIACVALLPDADKARRAEGSRKLRESLEKVPPSPYSEAETYRLIDEAIAEIRKQDKKQAIT